MSHIHQSEPITYSIVMLLLLGLRTLNMRKISSSFQQVQGRAASELVHLAGQLGPRFLSSYTK